MTEQDKQVVVQQMLAIIEHVSKREKINGIHEMLKEIDDRMMKSGGRRDIDVLRDMKERLDMMLEEINSSSQDGRKG